MVENEAVYGAAELAPLVLEGIAAVKVGHGGVYVLAKEVGFAIAQEAKEGYLAFFTQVGYQLVVGILVNQSCAVPVPRLRPRALKTPRVL